MIRSLILIALLAMLNIAHGQAVQNAPPGAMLGVPVGGSQSSPQALVRPVFNAADYGAKGDGITDDTAALQAFLSALNASSGGEGHINAGTFLFSSLLTFPVNFRSLTGAGQYRTKLVYIGANTQTDLLQIEGSAYNSILGFSVVGGFQMSSHTQMQGGAAIHLKWVAGLTLRDIALVDANCSPYTTNCDWLWNGVVNESTGLTWLDNYNIETQNDCIQSFGIGAGGLGPQYDIYFGEGKLAGCKGASGTASSGSTTTVVDTKMNWLTNNYIGQTVQWVDSGTTYTGTITGNTSTTITFSGGSGPVNAGDRYEVLGSIGAGFHVGGGVDNATLSGNVTIAQNGINVLIDNALVGIGTSTGGSTTTLIDTARNWAVNDYAGLSLTLSGCAASGTTTVTSNTATTMTFPTLGAAVTSGCSYNIAGFGSPKNQRVTVDAKVIDSATAGDNIVINDPFANTNNWCNIRITGDITGSAQGAGIHVVSWPSCYLSITNSQILRNFNYGLQIDDSTSRVNVDLSSNIWGNPSYAIYCASGCTGLLNLATMYGNGTNAIFGASGAITPSAVTAIGSLTAGVGSNIGWTGRAIMNSPAANQIQVGVSQGTGSSPGVTQTINAQHAGTSGTNLAGGSFVLESGLGTGTGTASTVSLVTPAVAGSGTTVQTPYTEASFSTTANSVGDATNNPTFNTLGTGTSTFGGGIAVTGVANSYAEQMTGLSVTSGTTGFGRRITGTVNDASAVDGIIDFANVTCTACTATSYLVDWQVAGASQFKVSTAGAATFNGNVQIAAAASFNFSGRAAITSTAGQIIGYGSYQTNGTTFTVSGCGTAASVTGGASGGTFTVGTGAGTCTFTFTISGGAAAATASHGWIANVDDATAKIHCTNTGSDTTTTAQVICNSAVTTGDKITFSAVGY